MAEQNTITIHFSAKGDKNVIKAINRLDKSTKKLIETQSKLFKEGEKQRRQHTKSQKAMTSLNVRLKSLDKSFKDVGISTHTLTKAYKGHKVSIEKVRNATNKYIQTLNKKNKGILDTEHSTRILGGSFAVLRSKLLLVNFAMAMGIRQLIQFTKESTKVQSMETAFNTLSGSTELSSTALKKLQDATSNTMSEFDLFQQANNAMILGVSKNSDEMAEMFQIAKTLGRALGRDTASSVESLITGIGRQSRLMLDNIGIIVKSEEAYESYADELGITTDKLSDAQKKQAFLNATMESARQKVATIGVSTLPTTQDAMERFSSATSNLSRALGETLSPMMSDLSSSSAGLLENLTELLDLTRRNTSAEMEFAVAQDLAEVAIKTYGKSIGVAFDKSKDLLPQLNRMFELMSKDSNRGKGFLIVLRRIEELEKAQERYNAVTADEKSAQARRDELSAIEKAKEAIRKKQEEQSKNEKMFQKLQEIAVKKAKERAELEEEIRIATAKKVAKEIKQIEKSIAKDLKEEQEKIAKDLEEKENLRKIVFKDTKEFRLEQINELAKRFQKAGLNELAYESFIKNEKLKIEEEFIQKKEEKQRKAIEKEQKAIQEIANANKTIYADNLEFQMLQIDLQADKFREMNLNEQAITEFTENAKTEAALKNLEEQSILYNSFVAGYGTFIDSLTDLDTSFEDKKKAILESTARAFISFLGNMAKEQFKQAIANEVVAKTSQATAIASSKVTGSLIAQAYAVPASLASTATFGASAGAGQAALTASITATKGLATFEDGGLVAGRRHSQGGTIIEAERGEFVMSRNAVQAIGVETLNQMNQGIGAGITVNVSAPLIDETILDTIIPAIEEAQRNNLA